MSFSSYCLYGLCIRSELPLTAPSAPESFAPDLTVRCGGGLPATATAPAGEVWAKADFGNGFGVQLTKIESGWSLFYPQTGEVRLANDLRTATAHALPGKDAILPLLLIGSVPAWWLNLRGESILHASAVAVGDEALAFIGASGMGKSTLATLLCSAGATLITDDVLRLQSEKESFRCHWGTGELRLRANAASLSELFPPACVSRSADGRSTLLLPAGKSSLPRLRAILIPRPSREHRELVAHPQSLVQASFHLNGFARVLGWHVDEPRRQQFTAFARVAQAVPVVEVTVPWGPPFPPDLPDRLFAVAGMTLGETAALR